MKNNVYVEIEETKEGFMIIDWTHWFVFKLNYERGNLDENYKHHRDAKTALRNFVTIAGNTTNYHIKGFGSNEQRAKQFAIWYHVNKSIGSVSTYRLD